MTMRNDGIVFSPTLGIPAGVFSLMLGEFNRVFNVEAGDTESPEIPSQESIAEARRQSAINRRNSRQYSDAAADTLLGLGGRQLPTTGEEPSDDEEISIQEESGAETTEPETESILTVDSEIMPVTARPNASTASGDFLTIPTSDTSTTITSRSRAANLAASRGLAVKTERRRSAMMGLPVSPRPSDRQFTPLTPTTFHATGESTLAPPGH